MHSSARDMRYPSDGDCFIPEGWERKRQFLRTYYARDSYTGQYDLVILAM